MITEKKDDSSQSQKMAEQWIHVLKADPEFKNFKRFVPKSLRRKELGRDYRGVTNSPEFAEKKEDVILLSPQDWKKYQRVQQKCGELARRYGLREWVVYDLLVGFEPLPVPAQTIVGFLEPFVLLPKNFDSNKSYMAYTDMAPCLEAIEIMKRLPKELEPKTRGEIKTYLEMLMCKIPECQFMELQEQQPGEEKKTIPEIWVHIRVPPLYSGNEVSKVYKLLDEQRRMIAKALGIPLPRRRRTSTVLKEVEELKLFHDRHPSYLIMDERFGEDIQPELEQKHRREIADKRHKGRKILGREGKFSHHQKTAAR